MKRTDRPFWAGVVLGAGTVAAVVAGRWWWEWHGWRSENQAPLPEWCPGIDPVCSYALPDEPVGWRLCGDYQGHFPHLRSAEPEYVADRLEHEDDRRARYPVPPVAEEFLRETPCLRRSKHDAHGYPEDVDRETAAAFGQHPFCPGLPREPEIWCPGIDSTMPTAELPDDWTPHRWEPCTATIRHNAHKRWDRRQPGDPEITVTDHSVRPTGPWLPAPVVDPAAMEEFKRNFRAAADNLAVNMSVLGERVREAVTPLAPSQVSGHIVQCQRDHPHPVHVHEAGVCNGLPTSPGDDRCG